MAKNKNAAAKSEPTTSTSSSKNSAKSVSRAMKKSMRRDYMADPFKRSLNQQKAIAQKKRVVLTEPNPNPNETNKRFVRRVVLPYSKNSEANS